MKRMSQMLRPDEPLEEELHGLAGLGAIFGLIVGGPLFGSLLLGMVLGVQLAPALGFIEGGRGDQIRASGWRAARSMARVFFEVHQAWDALETCAHRMGLAKVLRRIVRSMVAVARVIERRVGATSKARKL
ncbi:MAG: hypothetical protein SGPRY_013954, partial [Prymnesium sp.]